MNLPDTCYGVHYNDDGFVVPVAFRHKEDGWSIVVCAPDWLLRAVFPSGFKVRQASKWFQDGKYRSVNLIVSVDR